MCILVETKYKDCSCINPSVQKCPRCPDSGFKKCIDYKVKEEWKEGNCVGMGECHFISVTTSAEEQDKDQKKKDDKSEGIEGEGRKSLCEKLGILFGGWGGVTSDGQFLEGGDMLFL